MDPSILPSLLCRGPVGFPCKGALILGDPSIDFGVEQKIKLGSPAASNYLELRDPGVTIGLGNLLIMGYRRVTMAYKGSSTGRKVLLYCISSTLQRLELNRR